MGLGGQFDGRAYGVFRSYAGMNDMRFVRVEAGIDLICLRGHLYSPSDHCESGHPGWYAVNRGRRRNVEHR